MLWSVPGTFFFGLRLAQFEDGVAAVAQLGWNVDGRAVGLGRDEEVAAFALEVEFLTSMHQPGMLDVRRHAAQDNAVTVVV